MRSEPKPLNDWLLNPSSGTGALLTRIQHLETLNIELQHWLNTPTACAWASSVRVASFEGGTLTLFCADASTLTLLRYRTLDALTHFRQKLGGSCARIEAKVRPRTDF